MDRNNVKLGVIGCGKMANAILGGVYKSKFLNPEDIYVFDVNENAKNSLKKDYGHNTVNSIEELLNSVNTLLIATKPFIVNDILNEINKNYKNQLILSILAGVKIEKYRSVLKEAKVIRIMPNTPALVNCGMSAVCASDNTDSESFDFAFELMKNCGKTIKTTEDKMDIITALSGSGPAYYYKIIELFASAAEKLGLNKKEALLLSAQTAAGASKMVLQNDFDIPLLIKNVTTPGGCTEVGNNVLNESNIESILYKTISDTMQKAIELG